MVHQISDCESAMLCIHDVNETQYKLSDLDFLCFEAPYSTTRVEEWRVSERDPIGTVEMRPPEVRIG